jgi:membrane fusion protein, multidrug efflux system
MTRNRRITSSLIAGLVIAGVVGIYYMPQAQQTRQVQAGSKGGQRTGGSNPAAEPVPVLASPAKSSDVPVYFDGVGTAKALNTVTVRTQVDGQLVGVMFKEGQDVTKGYLLAKVDPVTYQAAYDQTVAKKAQDEAQLANAKLDLERYTKLAVTNAVNKQQLDTQKAMVAQLVAQVQLDQAAIDNARAILSYTNITAPIAGRTGIRLVDQGNLVKAGENTAIVIITQVQPISIFFNLPQQELPELSKAFTEGSLPVDALGPDGKTALDTGKVVVIDNQIDQTTGTVRLKAEFPNASLQLWPGQFVNVRVLMGTLRQVVVVPTAAIQRGPDGTFVYVIKDDNTITARRVTLAQQDDVQTVVADGIQPGERVVTSGFARLTEGMPVSVTMVDTEQVSTSQSPRIDSIRATPPAGERGGRARGSRRQPAVNP